MKHYTDFIFTDWRIYNILQKEWLSDLVPDMSWEDYILSLNLGIECTSFSNEEYRVTDEKLWMIARIKYGI